MTAGVKAFRESWMQVDLLDPAAFGEFEARRLRYQILWAFYANTAYSNLHKWAPTYRHAHHLYKHLRGIYNPALRLGDFWQSHLMGGAIDRDAGDGVSIPSALPIEIRSDHPLEAELREAISRIWTWSNWSRRKDLFTLLGAVLGDVGLKIVDDVERGKVFIEVIHPGTIKALDRDSYGFVKGYELQEERDDGEGNTVLYGEIAERDGDDVVYTTLKDGKEFAWNGQAARWSVPYGFVPFVAVQFNDVGLDWGWSVLHASRWKVQEVDDLASMLHDQIRKTVNVVWMFGGVDKPKSGKTTLSGDPATSGKTQPERTETHALYGPVGATAQPLVAPLDITGVLAEIKGILEELERDHPELQMDIWTASGDRSGKALRIGRQRVELIARKRRTNFDEGLIQAQQMAITLAGRRNLERFTGFNLDSFEKGDLDHQIGNRPVFATDPLDKLEETKAFWDNAFIAVKAGATLEGWLSHQGWTEEEINSLMEGQFYPELAKMIKEEKKGQTEKKE